VKKQINAKKNNLILLKILKYWKIQKIYFLLENKKKKNQLIYHNFMMKMIHV
jgi:hypothetical protein